MMIVPSNAGPPVQLTFVIKSPLFGPDLTTVTAVSILVRRSDGSTVTWAAAIASATSREIVAQYALQVGDITATGPYALAPELTLPGGTAPCFTVALFVASPFNCTPILQQDVWVAASSAISPDTGGLASVWKVINSTNSPFQASALQPWIAVDLSTAPVSVNLWSANDGDVVALTDYLGKAGTNALTINAAAGQEVPTTVGNYGSSAILTAPGVYVRMKFSKQLGLWIPTW